MRPAPSRRVPVSKSERPTAGPSRSSSKTRAPDRASAFEKRWKRMISRRSAAMVSTRNAIHHGTTRRMPPPSHHTAPRDREAKPSGEQDGEGGQAVTH